MSLWTTLLGLDALVSGEDEEEEEEDEDEESEQDEEGSRSSSSREEGAAGANNGSGSTNNGSSQRGSSGGSGKEKASRRRGEDGGGGGSGGGGNGKREKSDGELAIDTVTAQDCSYNPVLWSKRQKRTSANVADMLVARRQGFNIRRPMAAPLGCSYIPNRFCRPLGFSAGKMFCGRFSTSGDVLLTASQEAIIKLYDSESVYQWSVKKQDPRVDYHEDFADEGYRMLRRGYHQISYRPQRTNQRAWKGAPEPIKTISCLDTGWSVICTDFSPDEKWLAYSSWSPFVHLCNTRGEYELHQALDFRPKRVSHFCLFSIQFSPSNTHILGGGSDNHVYLYSLERKERVARINAHQDDVNAVAFADQGSQVVLSGGDDCVIKVWDLRSPDSAVGGLCGHQAGVTCITAKGDGHHFISNGKDQTLKLWDMRRMLDPKDHKMVKAAHTPHWDYRSRMPIVRRQKRSKRTSDEAVKTFHGHKVLQTLIRCHFSPTHTTGQRFVMSGSSDGRVCIWDILTGDMVQSLSWHRDNTRDVSWHPYLPLMASFSWDSSVGLWSHSAPSEGGGAACA